MSRSPTHEEARLELILTVAAGRAAASSDPERVALASAIDQVAALPDAERAALAAHCKRLLAEAHTSEAKR